MLSGPAAKSKRSQRYLTWYVLVVRFQQKRTDLELETNQGLLSWQSYKKAQAWRKEITPGYYKQKNFLAAGPRKHCKGPTTHKDICPGAARTRLQATYISETVDTGTAGARDVFFTQP
jgi:hypothetical protein